MYMGGPSTSKLAGFEPCQSSYRISGQTLISNNDVLVIYPPYQTNASSLDMDRTHRDELYGSC